MSSAENKCVELYLRSPYIFMARCLIEHRNNFTVIFSKCLFNACINCRTKCRSLLLSFWQTCSAFGHSEFRASTQFLQISVTLLRMHCFHEQYKDFEVTSFKALSGFVPFLRIYYLHIPNKFHIP